MCLPGVVSGVTGGRAKGLTVSVRLPEFGVVLLPARVLAQDSVGFIKLNKLSVQRRVGWVTIWVQLHGHSFTAKQAHILMWTLAKKKKTILLINIFVQIMCQP